MLIGKEFKALSHLADTKTGKRPVLECIHFTPDFAESADGFILLQVPYSKEFKEENYPPTLGAGANEIVETILRAKAIVDAIKRIPKLKHLPITEEEIIDE